jgi:hypothetical protein
METVKLAKLISIAYTWSRTTVNCNYGVDESRPQALS